ncbi:rCG25187 [Rattus norvegicus]|uniref:RCG25187 n=1 Tax=Rattus norvegicus TaxID=10116 RepID=A6I431_RAT|nr:rCG25187 [Rattus norvegicus]
MPMVDSSREPD